MDEQAGSSYQTAASHHRFDSRHDLYFSGACSDKLRLHRLERVRDAYRRVGVGSLWERAARSAGSGARDLLRLETLTMSGGFARPGSRFVPSPRGRGLNPSENFWHGKHEHALVAQVGDDHFLVLYI